MDGKKRITYLEILRVISIALVVLNHTDLNYYYYHDPSGGRLTFLCSVLVTVLCRIDVPLFFMISGALLIGKKESIRDLYRKRFLRLFGAFLLFSALQYAVKAARGQIEAPGLSDFGKRLLGGQIQETYWFLYAYAALLILLPVLREFAAGMTRSGFLYLAVVLAAADLGTALLGQAGLAPASPFLADIQVLARDAFYMLAGWMLERDRQERAEGRSASWLPALALLLVSAAAPVCAITLVYARTGQYADGFLGAMSIPMALGIFALLGMTEGRMTGAFGRAGEKTAALGRYVFGMYLTEWFARILWLPLYLALCGRIPGVLACLVYTFVSLMTSLAFSWCLSKVPGLRRLL